jgi:hypothetical protein
MLQETKGGNNKKNEKEKEKGKKTGGSHEGKRKKNIAERGPTAAKKRGKKKLRGKRTCASHEGKKYIASGGAIPRSVVPNWSQSTGIDVGCFQFR